MFTVRIGERKKMINNLFATLKHSLREKEDTQRHCGFLPAIVKLRIKMTTVAINNPDVSR